MPICMSGFHPCTPPSTNHTKQTRTPSRAEKALVRPFSSLLLFFLLFPISPSCSSAPSSSSSLVTPRPPPPPPPSSDAISLRHRSTRMSRSDTVQVSSIRLSVAFTSTARGLFITHTTQTRCLYDRPFSPTHAHTLSLNNQQFIKLPDYSSTEHIHTHQARPSTGPAARPPPAHAFASYSHHHHLCFGASTAAAHAVAVVRGLRPPWPARRGRQATAFCRPACCCSHRRLAALQ